jgi:hypothetical protein
VGRISQHLRQNVVAYVAVFLALGGIGYAAGLQKNSVKSKHIKDGQVRSDDVADDSLTGQDVLESSLSLPSGPQGPTGQQGPQGVPGEPGTGGSSDTAAQILAKLLTVDGPGSQLNADQIDGQDATAFLGASAKATDADKLDDLDSTDFVRPLPATFISAGLPEHSGGPCFLGWHDSSSADEVGYYRDPFGMVFLQGVAKSCMAVSAGVLSLPPGYRPVRRHVFTTTFQDQGPGFQIIEVDPTSVNAPDAVLTQREVYLDGIVFRCGPSGVAGCP